MIASGADRQAQGLAMVALPDSGLLVPEHARRPEPLPTALDLFAGAGGMSLGFHQAGIDVVGAVEIDVWAAMTYLTNLARYGQCTIHFENEKRKSAFSRALDEESERMTKKAAAQAVTLHPLMGSGYIAHHPDLRGCRHFWLWDARTLRGAQILEALAIDKGEIDCVAGGPPCQGFSTAGKRDVMDPRNSLVFEFARLVLEIGPKSFCMENVPGMLSMRTPDGIPVADAFASILHEGGWSHYEAVKRMLAAGATTAAFRGGLKNATKGTRASTPKARPEAAQQTLF